MIFEPYNFGSDYRDAHLSKVEQSPEDLKVLLGWAKDAKNILYLYGNVGTGKSYFSAAFYNFLLETRQHVRCYSEEHFFSELKVCIGLSDWEPTQRIKTICEAKFLILDDLGSSKMTEWQKEMLFYLLDIRSKNDFPTLITSNLGSRQLKETFHERFCSRIFAAKNIKLELTGDDRRLSGE